jgi:hypothetical protein
LDQEFEMLRTVAAALVAALLPLSALQAQSVVSQPGETRVSENLSFGKSVRRKSLGHGRLITNDFLGDGKDRWRTGSLTTSRAWGYSWDGQAPSRLGEMLELRFQGQIIAPDNLTNPPAGERPYAGALSFGMHTHALIGRTEVALGGDLVLTGPQTSLDGFHNSLHDLASMAGPSDRVKAAQIENKIRPTLVAEAGRTYEFSPRASVRPFVEARAGDETLVRMGADVTIGTVGTGELLVRESITGQRYRVIDQKIPGMTFVMGIDIAHVADSIYLPENRGYTLTDTRDRVRAGLHWQGENAAAFYGVTWLGREFETQTESQVVGSIRLKLEF